MSKQVPLEKAKELRINADFNKQVLITPEQYQWVASPIKGVERMMLDRIGNESARATSLVRYQANSYFSEHVHSGGEEFYVLEGAFADEHGEYPAGSYVRNPIGTKHSPKVGENGAIIFVKLQQFATDDRLRVNINTHTNGWRAGLVEGLQVMPLHQHNTESVALVKWAPFTQFQTHTHWGGEEILVLDGVFKDEYGSYPKGSWLRSPHMSTHTPFTEQEGALILVKVGHLAGLK
ncbi:cupin domain-containing protein [Agaribacterium sp. ZY112]|uniref:cupin domain-containing protein n=1 Tax=Agaribacterium sp. ZY112 TaxID=3233574 RepID=UPI003525F70E